MPESSDMALALRTEQCRMLERYISRRTTPVFSIVVSAMFAWVYGVLLSPLRAGLGLASLPLLRLLDLSCGRAPRPHSGLTRGWCQSLPSSMPACGPSASGRGRPPHPGARRKHDERDDLPFAAVLAGPAGLHRAVLTPAACGPRSAISSSASSSIISSSSFDHRLPLASGSS